MRQTAPRLSLPRLLVYLVLIGFMVGMLWHSYQDTLALRREMDQQQLSVIQQTGETLPAVYQIGAGDTLWSIASVLWPGAHTGQKVYELRELNPGIDPGRLYVGQVIRIR